MELAFNGTHHHHLPGDIAEWQAEQSSVARTETKEVACETCGA
jgi:hypothetical protein